ncbi:WG repeat-containing protein [Phosphitispora sp. TUW77]|uniref:WG repeat-containing protein n=1 Tax=Phosphitispora sp. TUW77 TaxID=3152361 RepID=UPI003AB3C872
MKKVKRLISNIIGIILISSIVTPVWAAESLTYKVEIPCQFDGYGGQFHQGLARVQNGGKFGLIDISGDVIVNFVYDELYYNYPDDARPVPGNYLITIQNHKWGVIDNTGNLG